MRITLVDLNKESISLDIYESPHVGYFLSDINRKYGWENDKVRLYCGGHSLKNEDYMVFLNFYYFFTKRILCYLIIECIIVLYLAP